MLLSLPLLAFLAFLLAAVVRSGTAARVRRPAVGVGRVLFAAAALFGLFLTAGAAAAAAASSAAVVLFVRVVGCG